MATTFYRNVQRSRLRIALVAPPFIRVPPVGYGGTELVMADLATALAASGHEVTLFASGDSEVDGCETRWLFRTPIWPPDPVAEWNHAAFAAIEIQDGRFDIVHSHTPALLPLVGTLPVPVVHTVHLAPEPRWVDLYRSRQALTYVCISNRQAELLSDAFVQAPEVVHHGLDTTRYPAGAGELGDAIFLGRLDEVKAPHLALEACRSLGVPLRIAGRTHDESYFEDVLSPALAHGGGSLIGEVHGQAKLRALESAGVLVFPSTWEEPFGLALIEAMLCGTPIAALRRGSVAELVDEGLTGYSVEDPAELPRAIERALRLDRTAVRERARARYSIERMTSRYVSLYEAAIAETESSVVLLRG